MENTSAPEKEKKQNRLFLYLFIFMTVICAILAWLLFSQKQETQVVVTENVQLTAESEVLKRDLQSLKSDYEALQTDDEFLRAEIEEKKALIEQLQKEAEKHKDDAYIMAKLRKETKTLREIMKHFVQEIDSLNTLNKTLVAARDSVTTELHSEKQRSATLLTEKEKLYKVGSVIKASGFAVSALNVKAKNKSDETVKAKRTDKIKIAFRLEENKIAPKGQRTLYVRIVMPDGKEWCDSPDADHMFTFGTSKGFYAMKKSIQYNQDPVEVEMYVRKRENHELLPGKYLVEVTLDDTPVASSTLKLE